MGTATGFSGMGGAVGGILANLGTGYIVMHYTYSPLFLMADLMHPLSAALVYCLLPDAIFVMHFDKKQARCWSGRSGFDSGRRSQ
jgi:sugar phosphate permease